MIKNNYVQSENKKKVYEAFLNDTVREDHYSEGNGIYRFSAFAELGCSDEKKLDKDLEELLNELYKLLVKPSRIFVYGNSVEIDWSPNGLQVVTSKENYLNISLEFAKFLDNAYINKLIVNEGSFCDDPDEFTDNQNREINNHPSFDKECFGYDEIEIIDFRRK